MRRRPTDILMAEPLLELLATHGEMKLIDFCREVPRPRGDYLDFYPAAALLHAGYISTTWTLYKGGEKVKDTYGTTTRETAARLYVEVLPEEETFKFDSIEFTGKPFHIGEVFITAEGYLRLDELQRRRAERKRKRLDYIVSLFIAVLAVLLSSYLAHYFTLKRASIQQSPVSSSPPTTPAGR